jgi:CTP:molybdopterin cytidylyltransferase MocA
MSAAESSLHAIVLAAGSASRFGSPKQLARVGDRSLLTLAISRATEVAGQAVTVVLGAHVAEITPMLRHSGASIVINREWREGIASSIRAGLAQVPGSADGVLIVLADQPDVTSNDLGRLLAAWRRQPDSIAAASFGSTVGAPAIFPRWALRDLTELRGDSGARSLLHRYSDKLARVTMLSAAIDIDTPEDLLEREEAHRLARPAPATQVTATLDDQHTLRIVEDDADTKHPS